MLCTYDPATTGGQAPDGRKVKATIHWVSAKHAQTAEVRIYNTLFTNPEPSGGEGFAADLNPMSLEVLGSAKIEPALAESWTVVNDTTWRFTMRAGVELRPYSCR